MRTLIALSCGLFALLVSGCGPSAEEQATESFARFVREWVADSYPVDTVVKETTEEVPQSDARAIAVEKGYYQRQTRFENLQSLVLPNDDPRAPFVGVLRGERVLRSTPVHATENEALADRSFTAARFAYPEEHIFEYVDGHWKARR